MSLIDVLSKIQRSGGTIRVDAGDLVVAPASMLDADDYRVLATHKEEAVTLLGSPDSTHTLETKDIPWWWDGDLTPEENRILGEFIEHDTLDDAGQGMDIVLMSEECEQCHKRLGWVNMLGFERCLDCERPRDFAGLAQRLRERAKSR